MNPTVTRIKSRLSRLSFRTGLWVLAACALCYAASFAQMGLPISPAAKTALWVVLFGSAKALQYTALAILGVEGLRRIRRALHR